MNSEAKKWLKYYIYDFFLSINQHDMAQAMAKQIDLQNMPPARGDGFLFQWWSLPSSITGIDLQNMPDDDGSLLPWWLSFYPILTSKQHQSGAMESDNHFMSKL